MARILYINHYAGSERHGMEFRPFYLAREWQSLGHEVCLVAASFSHLRQENPSLSAGEIREEYVDRVRYVWLGTPRYEGNGLGRVRNMAGFVRGLYRNIERFAAERPDVVIASSTYPLDVFPSARIARRVGGRLIFEVHDLWPLSPIELGGMSRWHPFIMAMQLGEDYACRRADNIVSILPHADRHLVTRGMDPERYLHVPNGIDLGAWQGTRDPIPTEHATLLSRWREEQRFVLGYTGAHGLLNHLELLLDAVRLLPRERFGIFMTGQGPEKANLIRQAQARQLHNVAFLPPVPKRTVPTLLAAADALYVGFAPQPLFRFGVSPNKLMDYMMSARPIVAAMRAGNDLVSEHGCGITVPPDDPRAVAAAVAKLAELPPAARLQMGQRGRRAVEEHFTYPVLARRFAQAFAGGAGSRKAA